MPYTEFHYTPTGTGVISGKEVLEQTEDAINDLGGQISGDVQTAIDTANNALNTANTASADAQNAVNTANTAYTAATNAQNTANTAQNTASNALTAAQNAQNDVNALGNRVTTAENNISQNTSDISGLTTRMGTAEGNITTLQNDVITAQGTATSAQNTATLARGQAYVVRYASVAVSDNSTVPYTDLNNTDNVKVNDLLLDINGKFYQITSVDTSNETVSVTTPLTQLAVDANVMHLSGDEVVNGIKNFKDLIPIDGTYLGNESSTNERTNLCLRSNRDTTDLSGAYISRFRPNKNQGALSGSDNSFISISFLENETRYTRCFDFGLTDWDSNGVPQTYYFISPGSKGALGTSSRKWQTINGVEPSSLGMPDLSNGIDISGYFTTGSTSNTYKALADGYISILTTSSSTSAIYWSDSNSIIGDSASSAIDLGGTNRVTNITFPVNKGVSYIIVFKSVNVIVSAKFFPCLGNV